MSGRWDEPKPGTPQHFGEWLLDYQYGALEFVQERGLEAEYKKWFAEIRKQGKGFTQRRRRQVLEEEG